MENQTKTVDENWKKKAMESMDKVDQEMKAEAWDAEAAKYVQCAEVELYLTELSNVMQQISEGILESVNTMKERTQKEGDTNNDKD